MPGEGGVRRVIGIGNPDRGDDGVGRAAARWLRERPVGGIEIVEHDGEATGLLDCLDAAETVYLVDACVSGGAAGEIHRFDVTAAPLPSFTFGLSSHGLGLAEAVELARALGRLPPRCIVYAIEGEGFEPGTRLSPAVEAAVIEVGRRILEELG